VKSERLDAELEASLARAARALGMSHSEFIRDCVARRCKEVLGGSLAKRLAAFVGIVESRGGRASRTCTAFGQIRARRRSR